MQNFSLQGVIDTVLGAFRAVRDGCWVQVQRHFSVRPLAQAQQPLNAWWQGERAQQLLKSECKALQSCLAELYGNHMMILPVQPLPKFSSCAVRHAFSLSPSAYCSVSARANLDQLPLPESIVDVAVLQHTLEYSVDPHQFLREVDRVLTLHGHLVIVAFNPLSGAGIASSLMRLFRPGAHRRHHRLRSARVQDWLRLLNFESHKVPCIGYHQNSSQSAIMRALMCMATLAERFGLPLSSYYVIVAQKRVQPLTPSKPLWLPLPSVSRLAGAPFLGARSSRVKLHKAQPVKGGNC